jgi:hypothetical protein
MQITPQEAAIICQLMQEAKTDTDGSGKSLGAHAEVLYARFLACARRQPEPKCPHKWLDDTNGPVCEYCHVQAKVPA